MELRGIKRSWAGTNFLDERNLRLGNWEYVEWDLTETRANK